MGPLRQVTAGEDRQTLGASSVDQALIERHESSQRLSQTSLEDQRGAELNRIRGLEGVTPYEVGRFGGHFAGKLHEIPTVEVDAKTRGSAHSFLGCENTGPDRAVERGLDLDFGEPADHATIRREQSSHLSAVLLFDIELHNRARIEEQLSSRVRRDRLARGR
jgi:hypothetical protein